MGLLIKGPPSQGFSHHFLYDQTTCKVFSWNGKNQTRNMNIAPPKTNGWKMMAWERWLRLSIWPFLVSMLSFWGVPCQQSTPKNQHPSTVPPSELPLCLDKDRLLGKNRFHPKYSKSFMVNLPWICFDKKLLGKKF